MSLAFFMMKRGQLFHPNISDTDCYRMSCNWWQTSCYYRKYGYTRL